MQTSLSAQQLATIEQSPYKTDFPLLAAHPELAFLDSAATAQRPAAVLDAQRSFYETMNANPLRGLYRLSMEATQAIADARTHIARFIGATDDAGTPQGDAIVFTRNASEALNLLAHTVPQVVELGPGDDVVISIMEHHSNLIPWQQVCAATGANLVYLRPDESFSLTPAEIAEKIGPRAKIVSVTHVSNVLGVQNDVATVAARAHEVGALCIVDGAQSAPHVKVDVRALGCDFFAFSAHKLGGPLGIGVLWGRPELLDALPPFLTGGEMIDSVTETGAVWSPVPQKFEAGTQDAAGAFATDACLTYLEEFGMDAIEERERLLAIYLCERLQEKDY
ncbi:MAG: aminotransferase class V-fold PLP-dependent enzyme, partial [Coriobacteriales bacterium]|nr:aminotransferase class V-fold PLP-dependent enzyme [Coriobacteriales bacterium]